MLLSIRTHCQYPRLLSLLYPYFFFLCLSIILFSNRCLHTLLTNSPSLTSTSFYLGSQLEYDAASSTLAFTTDEHTLFVLRILSSPYSLPTIAAIVSLCTHPELQEQFLSSYRFTIPSFCTGLRIVCVPQKPTLDDIITLFGDRQPFESQRKTRLSFTHNPNKPTQWVTLQTSEDLQLLYQLFTYVANTLSNVDQCDYFRQCPGSRLLSINPLKGKPFCTAHLIDYKAIGRLIGYALEAPARMNIPLSQATLRYLLGQEVTLSDLKQDMPQIYETCVSSLFTSSISISFILSLSFCSLSFSLSLYTSTFLYHSPLSDPSCPRRRPLIPRCSSLLLRPVSP